MSGFILCCLCTCCLMLSSGYLTKKNLKSYRLTTNQFIIQSIFWLLLPSPYLHGQATQSLSVKLPVKEVFKGLHSRHKKALKKYSIYQPSPTFMGVPIQKWLYQWGKSYFSTEKIGRQIDGIKETYADRIKKTTDIQNKKKLITKRDKLIKHKERLLREGNLLMRMGVQPLAYDPMFICHNEKVFLNYLHSKGYLDAKITSKSSIKKNVVLVTYCIEPNKVYTIASLDLQIHYKPIKELLALHSQASLIKVGQPYHYQDFISEQERIINLLSDNGYFDFHEQYVYFKAHVSKSNHTLAVDLIIDRPESAGLYNKKTIGRIVVDLTPNKHVQSSTNRVITTSCDGIDFLIPNNTYPLKDLVHKIPLRCSDFYSKCKILETYERLYRIATFESIAILPKIEANQLVIYIHAKPYEKVKIDTEIGGECVNLNLKRLGPTIKFSPTIRRVAGLGILNLELSFAIRESFMTQASSALSRDMAYGVRSKFTIPRFVCWLPKQTNLMLEAFKPSTTIDIGYSSTRNLTYNTKKIDTSLHYDWSSKYIAYQFVPFKIAFDYPEMINKMHAHTSKKQLKSPSFLTSIACRTTISNMTSSAYVNASDKYKWMVAIGIEHTGVWEYLPPLKKWLGDELQLYRYLKIDVNYRQAFNLTQDSTLAYQAKIGGVKGYKAGDKVHPDTQYTMGGHGSVRAWDREMVGPGTYESEAHSKESSKGDLLLLANVELRKKLIGYLEGALFLDIGNTWQLQKNAKSETKFYFDKFYKTFAIGSGFGLRLNFYNTFVLCGDLAFPLHRPSGKKLPHPKPVFNLSIGYPF